MFKKYLIVISILLLLLPIVSCSDFLDLNESTGQTKEDAFYSDFAKINQVVSNIYSFLPDDFGVMGGGALRESATDNAVFTWSSSAVYKMYSGSWTSLETVDDQWANYYKAIRSANLFLENYSLDAFKKYEWNDNYKDDVKRAKRYNFEVRALRAFYYFELVKRYGDVPLLTRSYSAEDINSVEKTSFDKVILFITNECDSVAPELPITQQTPGTSVPAAELDNYGLGETGRVTRGFVMALKSRALLYAASPLHNPDNLTDKWKIAADAAKVIIEKNWYSLDNITVEPIYSANGGHDILKSKQLIFVKYNGDTNGFEAVNSPIGYEGGSSGNTPTQNLVDAYETKYGTAFDWNNPTMAANPYINRDPRFYKTILYNGATFMKYIVQTFVGGRNASPLEGATMTGYYLKKYMNETVSLSAAKPISKPHHYILFRYAEILLNYAEAMNEWKGPDYTDDAHPISARSAINQVRAAATMPNIIDQGSAFTARLRNERRIELAFEDHRFWDIRRWKIGEVVKDVYGIKITNVNSVYTYEKTLLNSHRFWDDRMYLYPISQSEVYKNSNLTQNLGW